VITGNTHFALAVQVLATLALEGDAPVSSRHLAQRIHTHPAFLRGLLGRLRKADLVQTRRGAHGGSVLARPAAEITLLDIYRVTDGHTELAPHDGQGSSCPVACAMPAVLADLEQRLDDAVARELRSVTIAQVTEQLQATDRTDAGA